MKKILSLILLIAGVNIFVSASDHTTADSTHQISILTWNIKMLPRGATFLHHHPIKRAKLIPAELMKISPDVIVFQESYDGKAVRMLRKALKTMYPYNEGFQNRKVITYKRAGGVLMFSKYPMKEIESIKYSMLAGIDKPAAKGAMLVEVEYPAKKFQVLGTHMQAGHGPEIKLSQYKDAANLLKRHQTEGVPQFACGDFNTHKSDTTLYPKLLEDLQMEDGAISSALKWTSDHLLNDMDNYNPTKRNLIDYVFFKPNGVHPTSISRSVLRFTQRWSKKHQDLSDHFAVEMKMKL